MIAEALDIGAVQRRRRPGSPCHPRVRPTCTPRRGDCVAIAAMRSVSLTRSSARVRDHRPARPRAHRPRRESEVRRSRSESPCRRSSSPLSRPPRTSIVPRGSPSSFSTISFTCAPMRTSTASTPVRVGIEANVLDQQMRAAAAPRRPPARTRRWKCRRAPGSRATRASARHARRPSARLPADARGCHASIRSV